MTDQPGSVITDPARIAEELKRVQAADTEQPLRFAAQPEAAAGANVSGVDELKPVPSEEKINDAPQAPAPFLPEPSGHGAPLWAVIPPEMVFPSTRTVFFLRFPSEMTFAPTKGIVAPDDGKLYRQAIVWGLSVGDQNFAAGRAMGDPNRFNDQLVRSMVRAIDGKVVDHSGGEFDFWWDEVGPKVRVLLQRVYGQLHYLKPDELNHFLANCVAARSAVG